MNNAIYGISYASRESGASEGTLRSYDKRGIVCPIRDSAGRRLYTESDIEKAKAQRAKSN